MLMRFTTVHAFCGFCGTFFSRLAANYGTLRWNLGIEKSFLFYEMNHFFKEEGFLRSEEHTSELQSRSDLVCRLLLEKKKRFRRKAGLPHRSLPRQGHRAEPSRPALWQRHFRASLEPQLRRSRANHSLGNARRRASPRFL